jgi:hypothetical protein
MAARLSLLAVLMLATSAHAECAWMLWGWAGNSRTPFTAYPTSSDCAAAQQKMEKTIIDGVNSGKVQGKYLREIPTCLPDSVDPRGLKGK